MNRSIWIFNHYAITPHFPGGTRHFELGKQLSENGYNVVIFASNFIHMNFEFVKRKKNKRYKLEKFCNLDFIWVKTNSYKKNDWKRLLNMFSYCYRVIGLSRRLAKKGVIKNPDIIIGSTVHPFAALTAAFIARRYKIPFIFEIRDLWPQTFIDMRIWKKSSFISRFFRFIEKKTVLKSNKIIVLSPKTKDYLLKRYNYLSGNIYYIPNGVNSELYGPNEVIDSLKKHKEYFKFIYTGGMNSVHNLDILFKAMKLIKNKNINIKLFLFGNGKEKDRFISYCKENNIENVHFMGTLNKTDIPNVLIHSDALYLSTANVNYGSENKLYEYLAAGKPIVSNVSGDHNNIVSRIKCGVSVLPEDPDALVHAIIKIYNMSEKERKIMGKNGLDYVKKNHDWKILGDKLDDLIINTLK